VRPAVGLAQARGLRSGEGVPSLKLQAFA